MPTIRPKTPPIGPVMKTPSSPQRLLAFSPEQAKKTPAKYPTTNPARANPSAERSFIVVSQMILHGRHLESGSNRACVRGRLFFARSNSVGRDPRSGAHDQGPQ